MLLPAACVVRHRGPVLLVVAGLAMMWRQFGLGSNLFIHGNLLVSGCFLGLVLIAAALASVAFRSTPSFGTDREDPSS
jgi:hypothetical protein